MAEIGERLLADVERFKERVFSDPTQVLDPETQHHEFVSGNHGRKLDFDKIETGSDMYIEWVSIYARAVKSMFGRRMPDVFVGIANGANRLSSHVGSLLDIPGLQTVKLDAKTVALDQDALDFIDNNDVRFAVTLEDVGTTGSTTVSAVESLRSVDVRRIESVNGFQRNASLPRLDEARIPYHAVILEPLPMFSPEACATDPSGYCRNGVSLIPHGQ